MIAFKFLDNFTRCKHTMDVFTPAGVIEAQHRCTLPPNHPGMHKAQNGSRWFDSSKLKSYVENEGKSL